MHTQIPPNSKGSLPAVIGQRRWWLLILLVWVMAVGFSFSGHVADIRAQSMRVATEGARNMFRMVVLTRSWNASHGGVYVPVTAATQPNPYLNIPRRDVTTMDGQALTLINPAYMTRLISERAQADSGVVFRLTSLRPIRPQNAPDPWERSALERFEQGVHEAISVEPGERGSQLRYMAPLMVEAACMECHARQGYRVGDIRGGISVSQPFAPIEGASRLVGRQAQINYGAVFVLVLLLGWGLLELLRRRWLDLDTKIFELETTRGELVQSEKMASLGRMVAGFAHEINTPVGVAVGAVSHHAETVERMGQMLGQEEVSETALRAELEDLRQSDALALANLRRAAKLVRSFKRTSIDQASEQSCSFNMKELINDVLFALHGTLKRLPIGISVECPDDLVLDGVPGLVEQLLTNLIMNAIQHAFDDGHRAGTIRIQVERADGGIHLAFTDDGAGMAAESRARIFEPFYTTRRDRGGSGLGLYICYGIVTSRLGGTVQCHSEPGAGCRFDIHFPVRAVAASEQE